MTNRRTLIFVDNSIGLTGSFKSLKQVVNKLKSDYNIVYVSPDKEFFEDNLPCATHYQIRFIEIQKNLTLVLYPFYLILNTLKLRKIVKKYPGAILHMNDFYNLTGCVVKILDPKTPLVYHVRLLPTSYLGPIYNFLAAAVMRFANKVICCSRAVYKSLPDSPKKSVVYDAMERPAGAFTSTSEPVIVYLSNYIEGKGQNRALEILAELKKLQPDVRCHFYGGTLDQQRNMNYRQSLLKLAEKLELEDNVEFNGSCENIAEVFGSSALLLNCSVSESFSMVCLEALWHGLPVVTLNSGGPAELVTHYQSGLIYSLDTNAKVIAEDMNRLLADSGKRHRLAEAGRKFAEEHFSVDKTVPELEHIYTTI